LSIKIIVAWMRKGPRLNALEELHLRAFSEELGECRGEDERLICQVSIYEKLVKAGSRTRRWWLDRKHDYGLPYDRNSYRGAEKSLKVSGVVEEVRGGVTKGFCLYL